MSQLLAEDEVELQSLLQQLLHSISERISAAPSTECAEEILLHLEETDKNFHNYEFVKYLRHFVENSLRPLVEEETKKLSRGDAQHAIGPGHETLIHAVTGHTRASHEYQQMMQTLKNTMTIVVESLISKFEEDQMRKEEMHPEKQPSQSNNCSHSSDSFNQSYGFIRHEQLQALTEKLDSSRPKEVRWEALQQLCSAPPSDVLSCESWSSLRRNLCSALNQSDPQLSDNVLQFFAKSFSSSPLNVTREIYTSLAKSVGSSFECQSLRFPTGSDGVDINSPEISHLLKQIRLMNDFQKEVTTFWIRHPEKYMEEVIESTFSLLCFHPDTNSTSPRTQKLLEPLHLLALLDIKAAWFNRWMHGNYSRTVVLRLLETKYKPLLVAALEQCLHYSESCENVTNDKTEHQQNSGSVQRSVYSGPQLDYACFVHSLSILGKLIIYTNGRKLFPVKVKKRKDPISLTDLLVILINIMYRHPVTPQGHASHTDSWLSPSSLVMDVVWMLCERSECAAECLYQTPVLETLLSPVLALLNGQQVQLKSPASTLTLIADVLARIANTDRGLSLFLHQDNVLLSNCERTSAVHVIVRFTLKLLDKDVSALAESDISYPLCGAFIFVCRQIYNTCEGLQVLRPYGLHNAVAAAWKQTSSFSERVPTPVPGAAAGTSTHEQHNMLMWEETLLDSLLNFAATPKGVLLLQQTGAMNECVSYMFSRFTKKLQVSRCEKFGYGVMVTQVAATAPGVVALRSSGTRQRLQVKALLLTARFRSCLRLLCIDRQFITINRVVVCQDGFVRALILELWSVLECGSEDVSVVRPKPTPMDPIDRSCLKSFLSLVNLLSSSLSVWELVGRQTLPNKSQYTLREMPTSVPDLIDRLIAMNSDAKIQSLFHYEQSHTFGLRLLSVLCCNLDSFLLLESQYNICSMLLQSQRENTTESDNGKGRLIIDALSLERNHLLVAVSSVGGPSERRLPPRVLQEGDDPYPWPMFSCPPLPTCYTLEPKKIHFHLHDSELDAFLSSSTDTTPTDRWMEECRKHYCRVLSTDPDMLTGNILAELLEKVVTRLSSSASHCFFSQTPYEEDEQSVKNVVLSSVEHLGISMCVRYGVFLNALKDDGVDELMQLMRHVKAFLSTQRRSATSHLLTVQDGYPGHDWLVSTVFLLMGGATDRCLHLLLSLSSLLVSAFIWPPRIHTSVHVPEAVAQCGLSPVYWCTSHYVEMLLKAELPLVHSAFRMSGFTPSQMCLHWLTQCFWNYLDWSQICLYVSTCVLMGADYQVYVCVSVFKHLQPQILQKTQSQELQVYLKEAPIHGFNLSHYMDFMKELELNYRDLVLEDMRAIRHPEGH